MSGHDDRLSRLVLDQQVPDAATGVGVDTGRRLIQYDDPSKALLE